MALRVGELDAPITNVPEVIFRRIIRQAQEQVTALSRAHRQEDALALLEAVNSAETQLHLVQDWPYEQAVERIRLATINLRHAINQVPRDELPTNLVEEPDREEQEVMPIPTESAEPEIACDEWITQREAARLAGVSEPTIFRWAELGRIRKRKVGHTAQVARADIEARAHAMGKPPRRKTPGVPPQTSGPLAQTPGVPPDLALVPLQLTTIKAPASAPTGDAPEKPQRWLLIFVEVDWWHDTKTRGWMG